MRTEQEAVKAISDCTEFTHNSFFMLQTRLDYTERVFQFSSESFNYNANMPDLYLIS